MTETLYQTIVYLDLKLKQNFSPTPGSTVSVDLKIPCFNVQQGLKMAVTGFGINVDDVVNLTLYTVGRIYGKSRYDFRVYKNFNESEVNQIKTIYKRSRK